MKGRLLIVADLGLLKAYQLDRSPKGSPRMTLTKEVSLESAHQHLTEQITDSAGRRTAPGGKMGGGQMSDAHNLKLETKRRLVRALSRNVEELVRGDDVEVCWLAAHKEILKPLTLALTREARACIEKTLALDLTKLKPVEVLARFGAP